MNKAPLSLYDYMTSNNELVNEIITLKEEEFVNNDNLVNIGYAIISNIKEGLLKFNQIIRISDNFIDSKAKELFIIDKYINNEDYINGYLIYDFLKVEYNLILLDLKKLLGL